MPMFEGKAMWRRDTEPTYRSTSTLDPSGGTTRSIRSDTWPPPTENLDQTSSKPQWLRLERTTSIWEVQRQIKGMTNAQATFSIIASLLGACILALPFAVATTGWLFVPIFAAITVTCCYTARLLVTLVNEVELVANGSVSTYEALAEEILGRWGLVFTTLVIFVELYGLAVGYLILLGANLHRIFPAVSSDHFTVGAAVVLYPSLLVSLEALSNVTSLGLVSAGLVTAAVLQAAFSTVAARAGAEPFEAEPFQVHREGGAGESGSGSSSVLGVGGALVELWEDTDLFLPWGLGSSCGIALFSFSSHAIVPEMFASTKDKRSFPRVLDRAFACVLVLFSTIGSAGYLAFGPSVAQQFTLDLSGALADVACLAICVNVSLGFGLFVASPCKLLETALEAPVNTLVRVGSSVLFGADAHAAAAAATAEGFKVAAKEGAGLASSSSSSSSHCSVSEERGSPPYQNYGLALESDDDDEEEDDRDGGGGGADAKSRKKKKKTKASPSMSNSSKASPSASSPASPAAAAAAGQSPPPPQPWPLLRLGVVGSATVIALSFPDFALVLSLIGCVCDMTICFILPAVMHVVVVARVWRRRQRQRQRRHSSSSQLESSPITRDHHHHNHDNDDKHSEAIAAIHSLRFSTEQAQHAPNNKNNNSNKYSPRPLPPPPSHVLSPSPPPSSLSSSRVSLVEDSGSSRQGSGASSSLLSELSDGRLVVLVAVDVALVVVGFVGMVVGVQSSLS